MTQFFRLYATFARVPVHLYAAALAYYALLGLFPLILLLAGIAGILLGRSPELAKAFSGELQAFVTRLFPTAQGIGQQVVEALQAGAPSLTAGSVLLLLWSASHFFTALSAVLSLVFGGKTRGLQNRFLGLLGPVALGLALTLASLGGLVLGLVFRFLPEGPWSPARGLLTTYLTSTLVLFAIYSLLPSPRPPTKPALMVSLLAALGWNLVAWGLPRFLPQKQYALVFGPLASPALLLLGFYLLMWVLIAGAVVLRAFLPESKA